MFSDQHKTMVFSSRVWTQWFNTDDATTFGGDDESVQSIRKRGFEVCPGYNILSAQCRVVGSSKIFTENTADTTEGVDVLYRPCTSGGLYCRNQDQSSGSACQDYAVRFRCTTGTVTDEVVYTWVAVLAVVFLIIPIAWVLVVNLKKKCCRSAAQRSRDSTVNSETGTTVSTLSDGSADPPPSYDQLFGGGSPLGSPTLGYGSTTALLENEIERTRIPQNNSGLSNPSQMPAVLTNNFVGISDTNYSNNVNSNSGTGSNILLNPPRTRFFPGMHLPVFTIMRQISEGQITPPPTYDDALVTLGVALPKKGSS